jgi:hypothetical protein
MISKWITVRLAGGMKKRENLGGARTCDAVQPRGWGTSCKRLVLKEDGLYHCADCGLVFKKLVLETAKKVINKPCKCETLLNFLRWEFSEFFGYDCPTDHYRCRACHRVYHGPHFSREAATKNQKSVAAKKHVQLFRQYRREEREKRVTNAERNATKLKEALKELPKSVRQKLVKEVLSGSS